MPQVTAKHKIVRFVDGKKQEVQANAEFSCSGEEYKYLKGRGAVADVKGAKAKSAPAPDPDANKNPASGDSGNGGNGGDAEKAEILEKLENGEVRVRLGEVEFTTKANTVREDGTLTAKGEEAYQAAEQAAKQSDAGDNLV